MPEIIKTLGIGVTPMSARGVVNAVRSGGAIVLGHNLHSCYLFHTDKSFREVYDAPNRFILIDGQPVRWALNANANSPRFASEYRVGSVDWLRLLGPGDVQTIGLVGASASSNELTAQLLKEQTGARVFQWHGEGWNDERAQLVARELEETAPDLTLIGLGMPLQEQFLRRLNLSTLSSVALVGGAIDQLNGTQTRAPEWFQRNGIEWLYRLVRDPRKFGHRYLVEPLKLLATLVRYHLGKK